MPNLKFKASRKTTVIILVVLFFILGGTGVYLLWRVNQQKTLAPVDSDASDNMFCNCCPTPGSSNTEPDCYEQKCIREKLVCEDTTECESWDYGICIRGKCSNNGRPCDSDNYCKICTKYKQKCEMECVEYGEGNLKPGMIPCICTAPNLKCAGVPACGTQCSQGSQCSPCAWPLVAFCQNGNCACLRYDADGSFPADHKCDDTKPCTLGCPSGYSDYREASSCAAGEKEVSGTCYCSPCNNPYTTKGCCKPITATNTCDAVGSSSSITLSTSTPSNCASNMTYSYIAGDTDGVGEVQVKLNNVALTNFVAETIGKTKKITGTIPTSATCDSSKTHTLTITWKDTGGNSGTNCTKSATFKPLDKENTCGDGVVAGNEQCDPPGGSCTTTDGKTGICSSSCTCTVNPYCGDGKLDSGEQCEQGNPSGAISCTWSQCNQQTCTCLPAGWNIVKAAESVCVNDSTQDPKSQIAYTITITNNGQGDGTISKIEDILDSKILANGVTPTEITSPGTYTDGEIIWNFSPALSIQAGQSKIFTYKVEINKENFGTYTNEATLTPSSGATVKDDASIDISCNITPPEEEIPDTGLFDESENIVTLGAVLLFLGLGWTWLNRTYEIANGKLVQRSKERFEQRVVKN